MKTSLMLRLAMVLALSAFAGLPAYAEAEQHEKHADAKETTANEKKPHGAGHTSGLTRLDLGFWTVIVFGLLLLVLGKFAWGPIMTGLQKREDSIAAFHSDAEKARAEAEKLLAEVRSQRAKANDDIAALIAAARRDADAFREAEKARTAGDIQADRERMRREIETARDQALSEIWEKTVHLATLVSSKVIGRAVSDDDHRRLIDESLTELQQRINETKA